jgi:hypothetical protein
MTAADIVAFVTGLTWEALLARRVRRQRLAAVRVEPFGMVEPAPTYHDARWRLCRKRHDKKPRGRSHRHRLLTAERRRA